MDERSRKMFDAILDDIEGNCERSAFLWCLLGAMTGGVGAGFILILIWWGVS